MSIVGCGSDTTAPASLTQVSKFWALRLNYHAITLATIAPADTVTLVATPQMQDGTPLLTTTPVSYVSSDTAVQVSPLGKLQAHTVSTKTNITIIATMTVGGAQGVTLKDTAYVNVIQQTSPATIPVANALSIQPQQGDSAARPIDSIPNIIGEQPISTYLPATVTDRSGQVLPSVQVYYYVPNHQTVLMTARDVSGTESWAALSPGHVMIHAEALVYGKLLKDSCQFAVGYPSLAHISMDTSMATGYAIAKGFPDTIIISMGGSVLWSNRLSGLSRANDSVDVEFTNPMNVHPVLPMYGDPSVVVEGQAVLVVASEIVPDGGGNIAPFPPPPPIPVMDTSVANIIVFIDSVSTRGRSFPVAGSYPYHSKFFPGNGVIKVVANSSLP